MSTNLIDMFLASNASKFPLEQMALVKSHLENLDESKLQIACSISYTDPNISLIASILGGTLGIDRFLIGDIGLGVGKLLTCGGCGIWTIIDWFMISSATKRKNLEKLMMVR